MSTLLLLIIYIAFIGLGIPDSLFGTAWPAIYAEYELPISFGSFISVIVSCGTTISSMLSAKAINRFGTGRVTAYSTIMTALALMGFAFTGNFWFMCFCAIPLGLGAGCIDTALNNYVAIHYNAAQMSFLHCFYGVGISVSPYIMALVISGASGWRGGYRIAFLLQIIISIILFVSLPLWKKAHGAELVAEEQNIQVLSLRELLKVPGVKLMWCLFVSSVAIECTCGSWGSTFLVEYKQLSAEKAAEIMMFYYIGMTLGRFLSGVLAAKLHSWKIIKIGQVILGAALLLLLLPGEAYWAAVALFMTGLGNGPLFPNFNYLAPENFGEELSPSVIGTQMAVSSAAMMLAPAFCGILGQLLGMWIYPIYMLGFYIIMMLAMLKTKKVFRRV